MRPDRQAGALVVGHDALDRATSRAADRIRLRSPRQSRRSPSVVRSSRFLVQLPRRPDRPLHLPQRLAPRVAERVERANLGQHRQLLAVDAGARHEVVDRAEASDASATAGSVVPRSVEARTRQSSRSVAEPTAARVVARTSQHRPVVAAALRADAAGLRRAASAASWPLPAIFCPTCARRPAT